MKYSFSGSGNSIIVSADTESGDFPIDNQAYTGASAALGNNRIYLREYGIDKQNFAFYEIFEIDGVAPVDLEDAFDKILILIANFNGGGTAPNAILLTGTTEGNPVTGEIQLSSPISKGNFFSETVNYLASIFVYPNLLSLSIYDYFTEKQTSVTLNENRLAIDVPLEGAVGLSGLQDFTANIGDLDYIQKKYVDERGSILNTTTSVLNLSDLNTLYPNAKDGFSVVAPNVIGGGKYYIKAGEGWVYQQILAVV